MFHFLAHVTWHPRAVPVEKASSRPFLLNVLLLAFLLVQSTGAFARSAPESFADLVELISPSVVNITTSTKVAENMVPRGIVPEGSPFEDLFRDFNNRNPNRGNPRNTSALGSGFVVSEDGYVVTNNHVIEGADEIVVEFPDMTEYSAKVVGIDKNIDIALLKIEADKPLPFVKFGDSDDARVGDWVMAIGNPLGQGFSVSAGIISARNRILSGSYDDYIQTDAAINRGNSGGPLFSMDGDVIGVNTAILSPTGGSIGIGFSMSSNVVGPVVAQLREFGEVRRGWLGVTIGPVTDDIAQTLGMEEAVGAIISEVSEGGPADVAGLDVADVIILFDGNTVADAGELVRLVGKAPVGSTVKVVVLRSGRSKTIDVVLGQRPENIAALSQKKPAPAAPEGAVGLMLLEIDDALKEEKSLPESAKGLLVVGVDEGSDAYAKDIREGDIITDAGQEVVDTVAAFKDRIEAIREAGRSTILLLVRRDGQPRFVVVEIK